MRADVAHLPDTAQPFLDTSPLPAGPLLPVLDVAAEALPLPVVVAAAFWPLSPPLGPEPPVAPVRLSPLKPAPLLSAIEQPPVLKDQGPKSLARRCRF
jgi:hypothetical protein